MKPMLAIQERSRHGVVRKKGLSLCARVCVSLFLCVCVCVCVFPCLCRSMCLEPINACLRGLSYCMCVERVCAHVFVCKYVCLSFTGLVDLRRGVCVCLSLFISKMREIARRTEREHGSRIETDS